MTKHESDVEIDEFVRGDKVVGGDLVHGNKVDGGGDNVSGNKYVIQIIPHSPEDGIEDLGEFFKDMNDIVQEFDNYDEEYLKNREKEFAKIDINKDIHFIHGLPMIGKTTFYELWLQNVGVQEFQSVCIISYKEDIYYYKYHKYLCNHTKELLDNLQTDNYRDKKFLIIFDNFERIDKKEKGELQKFIQEYRGRENIANLKLFFISWKDEREKFNFRNRNTQIITLEAYNVESLIKNLRELGLSNEKIGRLKQLYKEHPLLLEYAYSQLKNNIDGYENLIKDNRDALNQLNDRFCTIFQEIPQNILSVFQDIVLTGETLEYHDRNQLEALKGLSLLSKFGDNYVILSYVLFLAKEFFIKNNDISFKKTTGITLINRLIYKEHIDENILQKVASVYDFLIRNNDPCNEIDEFELFFKNEYEKNDSFFVGLLRNDEEKNIKTIELWKDIIGDDYFYYMAVMSKQRKIYRCLDKALFFIEGYKTHKEEHDTFDPKCKYRYYFEKGNILKKQDNNNANTDEIIECYRKALLNREFINIDNIKDIENKQIRKKQLKTYMSPVIELVSMYHDKLAETENEKEKNELINTVRDLLYKDCLLLERHNLKNSAIYNMLGDFYQLIKDNYKALLCFQKAYEIKAYHQHTLFNLGKLHFILKNYSAAYSYFHKGIDENIFKSNNYIINRYYAICLREYQLDYDKSLDYLKIALDNIKKSTLNADKIEREKRETYRHIFITLIKKTDFDKISEVEEYCTYNYLIEEIITNFSTINILLHNILDTEKQLIIINWILETYQGFDIQQTRDIKSIIGYIYTEKCKLILISNSDEKLYEFLKDSQPILQPNKFDKNEQSRIASSYKKLLDNRFSYQSYWHNLLNFVIFSDDSAIKCEKLKCFFNIYPYNENNFKLLKSYKDICLSMNKLDFVDILTNVDNKVSENVWKSFQYDLGKIAQIYLQKKDCENADKYFIKALKYKDDYENNFNYAIFKLSICDISNFWTLYNKCVTLYSQEKYIPLAKSKKEIKEKITTKLNNSNFNLYIKKGINYDKFISERKNMIQKISGEFKFDLELEILLAYSQHDDSDSLKRDIAKKYYVNRQYFLAKRNYKEIKSEYTKRRISDCETKVKALKKDMNKVDFNTLPIHEKLMLADRNFNIGDYTSAFQLYDTIIQSVSDLTDIKKISDKQLDNYLYCASVLNKKINTILDTNILFRLGKRYDILDRKNKAIDCYRICLKNSQDAKLKSEAFYYIAKITNNKNDFEKALEYINESIAAAKDFLKDIFDYNENNLFLPKDIPIEIKQFLGKIYYLQAILLYEKAKIEKSFGEIEKSFNVFNRAYIQTDLLKLLSKKKEFCVSLRKNSSKVSFLEEDEYSKALEALSDFRKLRNRYEKIHIFYESAFQAIEKNPKKYRIIDDIIQVGKAFRTPFNVKFMDSIRDMYYHYDSSDSTLWMKLGTLFKEAGEIYKNEDEDTIVELYYLAEIFYNRMTLESVQDKFYFNNNKALLYMSQLDNNKINNINIKEYFNKIQQYIEKAKDCAIKCDANKRKKFLEYVDEHSEKLNALKEKYKNDKKSNENYIYDKALSTLEIRDIVANANLTCVLKLIYNYGFFLTYATEDGFKDGLLHKNNFIESKKYLFRILHKIKPLGVCLAVKVKLINDIEGEKRLEFEPSDNFEQEVLKILDDYILENRQNSLLDLSNMALEILPESIQSLQSINKINIAGNPLSKLRLDFFDTMPNLQTIECDKMQEELVLKLQSHTGNRSNINFDENKKEFDKSKEIINKDVDKKGLNKLKMNGDDTYNKALSTLEIKDIVANANLTCVLKLIYNYGFFLTYATEDGFKEGLLHKNNFIESKKYLFRILNKLNKIKPLRVCLTVKVKLINDIEGEKRLEFEPSDNFEQEVLKILDDYILENRQNSLLDLSNMALEFLPESIQSLQSINKINIAGNPLSKLRLDFFDTMPNLQTIECDKMQKGLVQKIQSHTNKRLIIDSVDV